MNVFDIDDKCCGCGMCAVVCPEGVNILLDDNGYYKSRVNEEKCLDCGQCIKVCPIKSQLEEVKTKPSYVLYSKKREDVLKSSSGGIAYLIASKYIELGYVIIGAAWSEDYSRVEHIVVKKTRGYSKAKENKICSKLYS